MIRFACPKCRGRLECRPAMAGQKDVCPLCGETVIVPMGTTGATAAFWAHLMAGMSLGLVPLFIWLANRKRDPHARFHGKQAFLWTVLSWSLLILFFAIVTALGYPIDREATEFPSEDKWPGFSTARSYTVTSREVIYRDSSGTEHVIREVIYSEITVTGQCFFCGLSLLLFAYPIFGAIRTQRGKAFKYPFVAARLCSKALAEAYPSAAARENSQPPPLEGRPTTGSA